MLSRMPFRGDGGILDELRQIPSVGTADEGCRIKMPRMHNLEDQQAGSLHGLFSMIGCHEALVSGPKKFLALA